MLVKAKEKFEISVDPLQLGENLLQVRTLGDMPIMLKDIDMKEVRDCFVALAKKQRQKILR